MLTRTVFFLLAAFAAVLIACSKEQKTAKEQAKSEKVGDAYAPDTTIAGNYFSKGEQFVKEAKYDSAIVCYENASVLYKKGENWEGYVRVYNKIGHAFRDKRDYSQAMKYLNQALETGLKQFGDQNPLVAESYNNLGTVYLDQGDLDQATTFHNKALSIRLATRGEQHPDVAQSYKNLGNVYYAKSDYKQAINLYNKAVAIYSATLGEQHPDIAYPYNNLGLTYQHKGDYDQSIAFYNKALSTRLAAFGRQHPDVAHGYYSLGVVYDHKAYHDQAIALYNQALPIYLATLGELHPKVADTYVCLGIAFGSKGDYDQAIAFHTKALHIYLTTLGEQHLSVANTYTSLGQTYDFKGDYDQAIAFHNRALSMKLAQLGEQHLSVAITYHNLAIVHDHKADYNQAIALYNKALSIELATLGEQHPEVAVSYNNLGDAYGKKGAYDEALEFYQQALRANVPEFTSNDPYSNPILKNILSELTLLETLKGKRRVMADRYAKRSHNLHDLRAVLSSSHLTVQLIDQMRSSYKAEGSKLFLAEQTIDIYDQAIQIACRLYEVTREEEHKSAAFLFAEKNKAGIMLETLSEAKRFAGLPDSLLDKEKQLRLDLSFYEKTLLEEQLKRQNADSAKITLWQDKVFALKHAYDDILQRFEKEHPDYYNLKYQVKTVSVPEVQQQLLDDKATLVEYFTGEDSIFIFAITKDDFAVKTSAKDSLFEQQIEQLHKGITQQDFDKYTQAAYRLHQTLLAPVADELNGENLVIVPDGALSAIPFEALLTEPVANGKATPVGLQDYAKLPYLVNAHVISYAYSATLLQQELQKKNRKTSHDYLAFAPIFAEGVRVGTRGADFFAENFGRDSSQTAKRMREGYLPDTKREVTGILNRFEDSYGFFERWFGSKSRVYLDREASETRLKSKDIEDYRFLHFATHGLINEKNPKLSGLLLAQEDSTSQEDGILHLGEIYNLNLNADLVVLSACETGLGQVAKGEGIIGLTRGFLYAGASNLLVSLWQVSDVTTADLMVAFYDNMLNGATKPEALAEAKRQLIRHSPEHAKPDYWAPFILIGK